MLKIIIIVQVKKKMKEIWKWKAPLYIYKLWVPQKLRRPKNFGDQNIWLPFDGFPMQQPHMFIEWWPKFSVAMCLLGPNDDWIDFDCFKSPTSPFGLATIKPLSITIRHPCLVDSYRSLDGNQIFLIANQSKVVVARCLNLTFNGCWM